MAPVAVTLATTAVAPAGTPPFPVTWTFKVPPATRVLSTHWVEFPLFLVSQIRDGATGKYGAGNSSVSAVEAGPVPAALVADTVKE